MAEVDALVAKGTAELEYPFHAADAQALEVELWCDAQEQIHGIRVNVRDERSGGGAAVQLL
ncbi:Uncharacterised protein [Mycobacterium tuberculosis]|nr:Uncharacterised protein [Mycobacterium tuberculosis]